MTVILLNQNDQIVSEELDPEVFLKEFKPFVGLQSSVLNAIQQAADFRTYKKGETLVSHGQYEGEAFYIVVDGNLKVTVINPETGAVYIETVSSGCSFGLDIAIADNNETVARNVTLSAETDTSVWIVDAYAFTEVISNRPTLAKNLLFFMSSVFLESRFKMFEFSEAPELSIYQLLLEMVKRDELSGEWRIDNLPKHRELAELANVEEEDAASAVATLIQENIAKRDYPGLVITDITRLNKMSQ